MGTISLRGWYRAWKGSAEWSQGERQGSGDYVCSQSTQKRPVKIGRKVTLPRKVNGEIPADPQRINGNAVDQISNLTGYGPSSVGTRFLSLVYLDTYLSLNVSDVTGARGEPRGSQGRYTLSEISTGYSGPTGPLP